MIWKSSKPAAAADGPAIAAAATENGGGTAQKPQFVTPIGAAAGDPPRAGGPRDEGPGTSAPAGEPSAPKKDSPFSHEPPILDKGWGHAKTMSAVLGEIVWLMSQSQLHKQFFISDLEWPAAQAAMEISRAGGNGNKPRRRQWK